MIINVLERVFAGRINVTKEKNYLQMEHVNNVEIMKEPKYLKRNLHKQKLTYCQNANQMHVIYSKSY